MMLTEISQMDKHCVDDKYVCHTYVEHKESKHMQKQNKNRHLDMESTDFWFPEERGLGGWVIWQRGQLCN